jgi:hypothetical protein
MITNFIHPGVECGPWRGGGFSGGGRRQGIWGNLFLGNKKAKYLPHYGWMIGCMQSVVPSDMTRGHLALSISTTTPRSPPLLPTGQIATWRHATPSRCALNLAFTGFSWDWKSVYNSAQAFQVPILLSFPLVGSFCGAFLGVCVCVSSNS